MACGEEAQLARAMRDAGLEARGQEGGNFSQHKNAGKESTLCCRVVGRNESWRVSHDGSRGGSVSDSDVGYHSRLCVRFGAFSNATLARFGFHKQNKNLSTQLTIDFTQRSRDTQTEKILSHLKSGRSITPLDALRDFGCFRLGGRIFDIRKLGYEVKTKMIDVGNGKHVAEYRMVNE